MALLTVPLAVALYVLHNRRRQGVATRFASAELLPNVLAGGPGRLRHVPPAILLVALAALLVGLARPHARVSVPAENATIMLAVDTSRSMAAEDVLPTRLEAARSGMREFLAHAPETYRVGVVSFASTARVAAPPTRDRAFVESALRELRTGEGTALGDAVAKAIEVGQAAGSSGEDDKPTPTTVLLVSDGKQDGGDVAPDRAIRLARQHRVPVYTIAMGTPEGVVDVPLAGGYTARVQVPPDPDTLRRIASQTGGRFFVAPTLQELEVVYGELASRLGREQEWREVTVAFAGLGALMLLVGGALSASWFRRVP